MLRDSDCKETVKTLILGYQGLIRFVSAYLTKAMSMGITTFTQAEFEATSVSVAVKNITTTRITVRGRVSTAFS